MRASRAIPDERWFGATEREVPRGNVPVARVWRVGIEAGRLSVANPVRRPLVGVVVQRRRGWSLLGSALLHGGLLAGVLAATARVVLPPEPEASIPLVFESASGSRSSLAEVPLAEAPPGAEMPAAPEVPAVTAHEEAVPPPVLPDPVPEVAPVGTPSEALPTGIAPIEPTPARQASPPLMAPPQSAAPDERLAAAAPARPRLPTPPMVRALPHLAPPAGRPASNVPSPALASPGSGAGRSAPEEPSRDAAPGRSGASAATGAAPETRADVPARAIAGAPGNVQPDYPEMARRRGIQGRVVVRAVVSPAGRAVSVEVAQSSGSETLDRSAVDAVRGYSFMPASRGGAAVQGVAELPFTFRLQ